MSYILDALVKADQERQRLAMPGLHTVPLRPIRALPGPWPAWLAGATLLAAGLSMAGFYLGRSAGLDPLPGPAPIRPAPPEPRLAQAVSPAIAEPPAAAGKPAELPARLAEAAPSPLPQSPVSRHPARHLAVAGPGPQLYSLAELPAEFQAVARQVAVSGVAYAADAKERMAIINDRAWREGEEVTEGLRIESIANDGVVFNLKGYRFRKGGA